MTVLTKYKGVSLTRARKKKKKIKFLKVLLFLLLIASLWLLWGNKTVGITNYSITNDRIPENFKGFRITQVSDLHNTEFGDNNSRLIDKIVETNPDIIVITGDIIDSYKTDVLVAANLVEKIVEIAPTYYVTGNHEFSQYEDFKELEKIMEDLGVHILRDRAEYIELNGQKIQLIGIDSNIYKNGGFYVPGTDNVNIRNILKDLKDDSVYSILLAHRPELFNIYVEKEIDLALTGHAHGGQFRIPVLGGLKAPNQEGYFPKYDSGKFMEGESTMIISRGLGNGQIPVRVNNQPELVVVELN